MHLNGSQWNPEIHSTPHHTYQSRRFREIPLYQRDGGNPGTPGRANGIRRRTGGRGWESGRAFKANVSEGACGRNNSGAVAVPRYARLNSAVTFFAALWSASALRCCCRIGLNSDCATSIGTYSFDSSFKITNASGELSTCVTSPTFRSNTAASFGRRLVRRTITGVVGGGAAVIPNIM